MSTEAKVAGHYTRGQLEEVLLQALARAGKDLANLTAGDLAAVDEFHVGGLESTQELAALMDLRPKLHLLDVGSGIGGPARYFAAENGCKVTGIDLTEEFVLVAKSLTRRTKLDHLVEFHQASALALPFEPATFDRAYMIHVGMNISDKAALYREVRRVLKPGGFFAIFDLMRTSEGSLRYPVPWALTEETSFVASVKAYRGALEAAGFRITHERGRRAFAIEFTQRMMARVAQGGPPALGLHLLMGETTKLLLDNVLGMMQEGVLDPVELLALAV
ncbi:MAG TPA: class I SAM-dependent methyltransferase [Candidatus Angelobacter sp.]|nr:class I SAM-dependent methyltransferase [Candidatus Angelobacter sp.]